MIGEFAYLVTFIHYIIISYHIVSYLIESWILIKVVVSTTEKNTIMCSMLM
jgi:hypothetical protein